MVYKYKYIHKYSVFIYNKFILCFSLIQFVNNTLKKVAFSVVRAKIIKENHLYYVVSILDLLNMYDDFGRPKSKNRKQTG